MLGGVDLTCHGYGFIDIECGFVCITLKAVDTSDGDGGS